MSRGKSNSREREIRKARRLLSDEQLVAIFRAIERSPETNIFAVTLANEELSRGQSPDQIFYTGASDGFVLSVKRLSSSRVEIDFGYVPVPLAGDGGAWVVQLDEARDVRSVQNKICWTS